MRRLITIVTISVVLCVDTALCDNIPAHVGKLTCPDAGVLSKKLFTGVCWSCIFPIRLFGVNVFDPDGAGSPVGANTKPVCICGFDPETGQLPTFGFTLGFWHPALLIEAVRRPMCFPSLFGMTIDADIPLFQKPAGGNIANESESTGEQTGFYNAHLLSYPLLEILDLLHIPRCRPYGFADIDILMFSEVFPNWNNPILAAILNPEAVLFANPVGIMAQPLECGAMMAGGKPKDSLFWTAGCWGNILPFTGGESPNTSPVRVSNLIATRLLAMLARLGILDRTVGGDVLCKPKKMPIMKKSQYKYQLFFPINESKGPPRPNSGGGNAGGGDPTLGGRQVPEVDPSVFMDTCCHFAGKSTYTWGEWRTRPGTGEDFVYLIWQWVDCCIGLVPGS